MTYVYSCRECQSYEEINRPIDDRDELVGCECGAVKRRLVGYGLQINIPRAFRFDGDCFGRGMDSIDRKTTVEADLKQYEANWDHKTPSKPSRKKTSMAELSKQFKGMGVPAK